MTKCFPLLLVLALLVSAGANALSASKPKDPTDSTTLTTVQGKPEGETVGVNDEERQIPGVGEAIGASTQSFLRRARDLVRYVPADVAAKTAKGIRAARDELDNGVTKVKLTVAEQKAAEKDMKLKLATWEAAKAKESVQRLKEKKEAVKKVREEKEKLRNAKRFKEEARRKDEAAALAFERKVDDTIRIFRDAGNDDNKLLERLLRADITPEQYAAAQIKAVERTTNARHNANRISPDLFAEKYSIYKSLFVKGNREATGHTVEKPAEKVVP
uniref:RxLR effector candidate protein n=1 Tax=Peronospora matthiolae TaxID=2874970 RepID=A0AAV1TV58_9STRA